MGIRNATSLFNKATQGIKQLLSSISTSQRLYGFSLRVFAAAFLLMAITLPGRAQTNPTAQPLPYSQDFSSLLHTSTTYPVGWQGWQLATSPSATFRITTPTGDRTLTASSSASINSGNVHNYNGKIGFLNSGSLDLSIVMAINTTAASNVQVAYDIMTIRNPYDGSANTRINEATLQYRVGTSGGFTSLTGIEYQNNTTTQTGAGITTPQNLQTKTIALPPACNNQAVVQLRWVAREISGAGSRPSFAIDNFSAGAVTPPDYTITTTGNAIVITDDAGNGETLAVSESAGNIRFVVTPTTRTYSINGGATTAFTTPADVALAGATSITINTTAGSDIINVGAFTTNLPSLTINGGTGDDAVIFNGDITFIANANLDVDLQNDDATPGDDLVALATNANLILSGTGSATIKVSGYVQLDSGASVETVNGNLTVEANQQAIPTSGSFYGVLLNGGALKTSVSGTLTVKGKGGTDAVGGQKGIYVLNSGQISGGNSGAVVVEGTGGPSAGNFNDGVFVDANGIITSLGGNVSVTGLGNGTGSSETHFGVFVRSGGMITAGGTGSVTVHGTGGATAGSNNRGVVVFLTNARITSSGGNVSVTGQGGGTGSSGSNWGVYMLSAGEITAGGSGSVTVHGTGGAFSGTDNYGVFIENTNTRITSSGGAVSVTGTGGGAGASSFNYGVYVFNGAVITSAGTGSGATVTVVGQGGNATGGNNYGVFVNGTNARISSSGGAVSVTGTGIGSAADILMQSAGAITTTSTSAGITLHSTTNGTWPNTSGTDVSTTTMRKTTFGIGSKLNIDIDGLAVNTLYQQLGVVGMIDLNGANLTFAGSIFTPALGNTFTIVNNDGTDPVIGTFNGLAEGATIPNFLGSGLSATITYLGGTGNDVVLTVTSSCTPPVVNAPTITQPTCALPLGFITVNATGTGALEYSIDNGANWESFTMFSLLAPGNYNILVRLAANPSCQTAYAGNPVTLTSPFSATAIDTWTGCVSTNWATPGNWQDGTVPTATDDVLIPDVANDPVVMASTAALAKSVMVEASAALTINATGSLTIEGATGSPSGGMYNLGTVSNNGLLRIGLNISPGEYGIVNEAVFSNNTDAELSIDRSSKIGFWNRTAAAVLTNAGDITIGGIASVNSTGIYNEGDVQNNGGDIAVDRFGGAGIDNRSNSTISNSGKIIVGKIAASGSGIYNFGHIHNLAAGEIEVDRTNSGIFTLTANSINSSFINDGKIAIGQTESIDGPGIYNAAFTGGSISFENNAGSEILLDRSSAGIHNETNCSFDNIGLIKIGTTAALSGFSPGVYNRGTFNNQVGGEIRMDSISRTGLHNQSGTFTNGGKIIVGINFTITNFNPGVYNEATFVNQADAELHIDRFLHVGFQNASNSSLTNAGLIKIGENVLGGNNGLYNDGTVDNQATGEIHVDNIPDDNNRNGVFNGFNKTFTNAGKIFIGSAVGGGTNGLFNNGSFNNSGEIRVDNIRGSFNRHGLRNNSGIFTNTGKITLGSSASIGDWGLWNQATFNNNAGGEISIDRCSITGLRNNTFSSDMFNNHGKLTIGANAGVGNWGIWNEGPFNNSGELAIDNATVTGLRNQSNTFTNTGSVTLGGIASIGDWGLWNQSTFNNNAGGEISIDRTNNTGLLNFSNTFSNNGTVTIGAETAVGDQALYNEATFNNGICAVLHIYAPLNNVSTFTNSGLFEVNTPAAHTNTGFTNEGIITYPQGNPIPNVTNNEIIIAPGTFNGCDVISPAFDLGSPVDLTIVGIFTDEAGTMSAGTYDVGTNTFTANPVLLEGTHDLFVKIQDGSGGCTRIVSWELTTQNCCDAPEAICKTATAVLIGNSVTITTADVDNGSTYDCGLQSITVSPNTFNCSHVGTPQTVTLTVTDLNGSSSSCTTTVTVLDNTPPTVTAGTIAACYPTAAEAEAAAIAATTATDNCTGMVVKTASTSGTCMATITVTGTDGSSNGASVTYNTRIDNTPPTVVCKTSTVFLNPLGNYTLLAADVFDATASFDNCPGELTVTNISPATVSCAQFGQTIPVTVTVQDGCGNTATCIAQITVEEGTTLPAGWDSNDVGNANGSAGYKPCTSNGQFTVSATGFSTSSSDVLHLTSQQLCGNGEIIARVLTTSSGGWAGITLRETLMPGSRKVALKTQLTSIIRREIRSATNGPASILNFNRPQHSWLRLVRNGSNFTGYTSIDGNNWSFAFSANMSMTGCIYAGLFAESINGSVTTTAVFDNVSVIGSAISFAAPDHPSTLAIATPDFEVYPNPTSGEVTINLKAYPNQNVRILLYDTYGKALNQIEIDAAETTTGRFNLSNYQDGVYFIRLQADGLPDTTKRVVLMH